MSLLSFVGTALSLAGAFTGNFWLIAAAAAVGAKDASNERKKQRRAMRDAINQSAKDRLAMVDVEPSQARSLCLGRVRNVEGIRRRWSSGTNDEILTLIVSFASHQIDGYEQWYLDDLAVTLDGDGWVQTAPYLKTRTENGRATDTLDGSGGAVIVLAHTPISGTVYAVWSSGSGETLTQGTCSVSMAGATATITGGNPGTTVDVVYQYTVATSHARIRPYLGTDGQNVGNDLAAQYPGQITSADRFAGIACAVVDFISDPDVFPTSFPSVTPVFRGALCFDPRDDSTAWTENPALHVLRYAEWYSGWNLDRAYIQGIEDAADACDVSTDFTLRKPDDTTEVVTLPRYRCGIVIPADADHRQAMDSIIETMAGADGWGGGTWRVRAGTMAAPVLTIEDDWLVSVAEPGGGVDSEPYITGVQSIPRERRTNRVTGSCVDPAQRYQMLPFPAVEDAVLIAAKGERPEEATFEGVNHVAHAQHLGSVIIRQAQAGLRLELTTGLQAMTAELFDVASVTFPDYGLDEKTCEVVGWTWSAGQAIKLRLAEITEAIYEPDGELKGRDPAPDSNLRQPWDVETLTGLAVTSGTTALTDSGSILTRTEVTWDAATGASVRQGGRIEVQYTPLDEAQPAGEWPSWIEPGDATKAVIPGLMAGRHYVFRVRAVQHMPLVRGAWSVQEVHKVASKRGPTIYRQSSAPSTGVQNGDEWYDTDDGNAHYVREAGSWVSVPAGTGAIEDDAVTLQLSDTEAGPVVAATYTEIVRVAVGPYDYDAIVDSTWTGVAVSEITGGTGPFRIIASGYMEDSESGAGTTKIFGRWYQVDEQNFPAQVPHRFELPAGVTGWVRGMGQVSLDGVLPTGTTQFEDNTLLVTVYFK